MRITVVSPGRREAYPLDGFLTLGGDPDRRVHRNGDGPWVCDLTGRGSALQATFRGHGKTRIDGREVTGREVALHPGAVIEVGIVTILVGYLERALPASEPLADVERELLATVAMDPTDDHARRVLADYWQQGADEARGTLVQMQCDGLDARPLIAQHGARWRGAAIAAGLPEDRLAFTRGFAPALVVAPGELLEGNAGALRLSPLHVRQQAVVTTGDFTTLDRGTGVTASGLARSLAIKQPLRDHPWCLDMLERERIFLGRIADAHVSRVVADAVGRDGPALVLAWAGTTVGELLARAGERGRVPGEAFALALGVQLCRALAAAHAAGITHTEVRRDHVMIDEHGHVTLVDFGHARSADLDGPHMPSSPRRWSGMRIHRFTWMSPEQVEGRVLTTATDVFSCALLLCELVDGRCPISDTPNALRILEQIRDVQITVPETASPMLHAVLASVLDRDPLQRPTAEGLGAGLARVAAHRGIAIGPEVIADFVRLG